MKSILIALAGIMLLFVFAFKPEEVEITPLPEYRETWEESEVEIVALKKSKKETSIPWDVIDVRVRHDALCLEETFSARFSGDDRPDWDSWEVGDRIPAQIFTLVDEQTGEIKQQVIARIF